MGTVGSKDGQEPNATGPPGQAKFCGQEKGPKPEMGL